MDIIDLEQEQNQQLLKRYNKRMNTSRVVICMLSGIMLIAGVLLEFKYALHLELAITAVTGLLFLSLAALSYKKPFITLLAITIVCVLFLMVVLLDALDGNGLIAESAILIPQLLMVLIMWRGTASALKYERLKKLETP